MERKQASDYPQELLDLFHEYQHGDISRRSFLDRAGKFAVGGLTAAAIFESLKPNYAWAQQVPKNDQRLKSEYVTVPSPEGNGTIKGYFVQPANASGKLPAVLVVHENRGLNPYIEDVARRFAVANFIALAPDGLTSVGGYPGDDEKGGELFRKVDGAKMLADFVAAAGWLKVHAQSSGRWARSGSASAAVWPIHSRCASRISAARRRSTAVSRVPKIPQRSRRRCSSLCRQRSGGQSGMAGV